MEFRQFRNTLDGGGQPHVSAALPLLKESKLPSRQAEIFPGSMWGKKKVNRR